MVPAATTVLRAAGRRVLATLLGATLACAAVAPAAGAGDEAGASSPRIVGRVATRDGKPVGGVRLAAFERSRLVRAVHDAECVFDLEAPAPDATATSADDGRFTLPVSARAMYVVSMERAGIATLFVGEVAGAADAPAVVLWTLPPRTLRGRIVGEGGKPVAGVVVTAGPPLSHDDGYVPLYFARSKTATDADGRFVFDRLLPSADDGAGDFGHVVRVAVRRPDGARVVEDAWLDHVQHADTKESDFVVTARGPSRLRMRATTKDGTAVAKAEVTALWHVGTAEDPMPGEDPGNVVLRGTTDGEGECAFDGLPVGRLRLATAFAPGLGSEVFLRTGDDTTARVSVRGPGTTCAGRVTDEAGFPVADAEVYTLRDAGQKAARTRTDAEGRFRLEGIPEPSPLEVVVPGRVVVSGDAMKHAGPPREFDADVRVAPPGGVSGRVVDEGGNAVGGGEVHVGHDGRRAIVGEDGSFLIVGLAPGEHALSTVHPDDAEAEWSVSRPRPRLDTVTKPPRRRYGNGRVTIASGRRVEGVVLTLRAAPSK